MFCDNCGAQIENGSRFCNSCGATLGRSASIQANQFEPLSNNNKSMSKIITVIAIIIAIVILITGIILVLAKGGKLEGIGSKNNSSPEQTEMDIKNKAVSAFASFIEKGEYSNAINQYYDAIQGNYTLESEAEEYLDIYYNSIVTGVYNNALDEATAKTKKATADKVLDGTNINIDRYTLGYLVDEALASKVAFNSGNTFFASNNYKDAIANYKNVSERDADYQTAQQKLSEAKTAFRTVAITEADKLANEKKYIEAVSRISEAVTVIPDDSELLTKLNVYSKNYVNDMIEQADTAFANNLDYDTALKIIKQAQQHFIDDVDLKAKEEYYTIFVPVSIYKLKPYTGGLPVFSNMKDTMGNTYEKSFRNNSESGGATYDIGKKYNLLKGTAAISDSSRGYQTNYPGYIKIYGDGKLLYSYIDFTSSVKPFEISVDITGVTDLKIDVVSNIPLINTGLIVLFSDVTLQRTAK